MKRTIIYAVVALGMTAVSCNKSGLESPGVPGEPNAEPVTIALSSVSAPVSVTTFAGGQGTKSTPEMAEGAIDGQIHDLWALQYDKDGKLVGTPYYTTDIPAGTAGTAGSGTDYTYSGLSLKLTSSGGAARQGLCTWAWALTWFQGTVYPPPWAQNTESAGFSASLSGS